MERVMIEKEEWNDIIRIMNEKGYSSSKMKSLFGSSIKNALYKGSSIPRSVFDELSRITGKEIKKTIVISNIGEKPNLNVNKDERLAELVGIMLGDGSLYVSGNIHGSCIAFNSKTEMDYVEYVNDLICSIFSIKYHFHQQRGNSCTLGKSGIELLRFFESIGLKVGDKVKNQVSVPDWVKDREDMMIACLRGLLDTDGCIYISKGQININFKNFSMGLLSGFACLCNKISVKCITRKNDIYITDKRNVKKFLDTVQPFKWLRMIKEKPEIQGLLDYKVNYPVLINPRNKRSRTGQKMIKIDAIETKKIYDELKKKGYSGYFINDITNSNFRNNVYSGYGCSMEEGSLEKLRELQASQPLNIKNVVPIDEFKELVACKTLEEIAAELDINEKSVITRCNRNGIQIPSNKKRRYTRDFTIEKEELEKLVWQFPLTKIANQFNISRSTIKKRCAQLSIEIPEPKYWNKIYPSHSEQKRKFEVTRENLERLVWENPTEQIGKDFGVSGKAIEKRCKLFGIEKPGRGYWQKRRASNPE